MKHTRSCSISSGPISTRLRTPLPGSKTPLPGSKTQLPGSKTQLPGSKTQLPGSKTQFPGLKTQFPKEKKKRAYKKRAFLRSKEVEVENKIVVEVLDEKIADDDSDLESIDSILPPNIWRDAIFDDE
jgi:hypothetical protein